MPPCHSGRDDREDSTCHVEHPSACHVEPVETSVGWDTMRYFGITMTLMTVKHGYASKGAAVPYYPR